eukprot:jgi/Hompol1/6867/HPOL_004181-RA
MAAADPTSGKSQGEKLVSQCHFNEQDFCQLSDEYSEEGHYVNLIENPERFTGYAGHSAARVWSAIYNENCFGLPQSYGSGSPLERDADTLCTEKRVFYKLISGLHSSISIHICDQYLDQSTGKWAGLATDTANLSMFYTLTLCPSQQFANLDCYANRIALYPERLENLYFVWAVMMRAASKLTPFLRNHPFCEGTGDERLAKMHVEHIAEIVASCPSTFDEKTMFAQAPYRELKDEFKQRFRNISLIMDCVGCEKCRLWGKLQVTGLGTALKVLFSYDDNESDGYQNDGGVAGPIDYRLTRSELVAFMNALHRLSESLMAVERLQLRLSELQKKQQQEPAKVKKSKKSATKAKKEDSGPPVAKQAILSSSTTATTTATAVVAPTAKPTIDILVEESAIKGDRVRAKLTVERLLDHTSIFEPRYAAMYIAGFVIVVLGSIRILQKGYARNLSQEISESKKRVEAASIESDHAQSHSSTTASSDTRAQPT